MVCKTKQSFSHVEPMVAYGLSGSRPRTPHTKLYECCM